MSPKTVLAVTGPTAGGKSALALRLCRALGGELLCMDSMQVYRGMDIGTAKPTLQERALVPHHLLDLRDPSESFSVSEWADLARETIEQVSLPVLCGGTGLYLDALMRGDDLGKVEGDEALREQLRRFARERGEEALHEELRRVDPVSAGKIHPRDLKRVVRALEVYTLTGKPISERTAPPAAPSPWAFTVLVLSPPREALYQRIDRRVDEMVRRGLKEEVRALYDRGVPEESTAIQGLGYKEYYHYFKGMCTEEFAIRLIKTRTRHYAKRQLTRCRQIPGARWIESAGAEEAWREAVRIVKEEACLTLNNT